MKFNVVVIYNMRISSPPARGAWVEITLDYILQKPTLVAPRTGGVG